MPHPSRRRRLAGVAIAALCFAAPSAAQACDRVASPLGSDRAAGTDAAPFRTVQKLADSLAAGKTGCLRAGTYSQATGDAYVLRLNRGGAQGAPLTLTSYPGERATLNGVIFVPDASNFVTISALDLVGTDSDDDSSFVPPSINVSGDDVTLAGNRITNNRIKTCLILGSNKGWGQAARTVVRGNVFHDCGDPAHGMLDHAIYFENTVDTEVVDNVFHDNQAYAIHLYPNAHRVRVHHNVMADNGGGVTFAGEGSYASSDISVDHNTITGSRRDFNVSEYWGGPVGTGNVAEANCLWGSSRGDVVRTPRGFVARDNVSADPRYIDAAGGDYRLASGSPCEATVGYDIAEKVVGNSAGGDVTRPTTDDPVSSGAGAGAIGEVIEIGSAYSASSPGFKRSKAAKPKPKRKRKARSRRRTVPVRHPARL